MPTTATGIATPASWDALLPRLAEVPTENGAAAMQQTATALFDTLAAPGAEVVRGAFCVQPYGLRLAGVLAPAYLLAVACAADGGELDPSGAGS